MLYASRFIHAGEIIEVTRALLILESAVKGSPLLQRFLWYRNKDAEIIMKSTVGLETSENELYLHISCNSNEPSINLNGIYSEADMMHIMVKRIGDRGEKSSKSKSAARKGGRKLHKKTMKKHRKK